MISDLKTVLAEPSPARNLSTERVAGGWREWFRPMMLAPTFATLALACIVGYQNFVSIPDMLRPQVLETKPFVPTTRGAAIQTVDVKAGTALFAASFEVATATVFPSYECDFEKADGEQVATVDCGKHPESEFTLSLLLPATKFPAGGYTMILRSTTGQRTEVSRYSFAIRNESQQKHG
jgi:hypothetical protein